jgi:8-oxo-dGTP diphosphatase
MVIPRTVVFLRRDDSYLLLKGAPTKRRWAGRYNGVGGHVDPGEDALSSAARELKEETGLEAHLWLCGTLIVDTGEIGVSVYVFTGEEVGGKLRPSPEGAAEWVPFSKVAGLPVVDDLPTLLTRIHRMKRGDAPFAARSFYDAGGRLQLQFAEDQ